MAIPFGEFSTKEHTGWQDRGRGGAIGFRQIHPGPPDVPLLRCAGGVHSHQWSGRSPGHAGERAPGHWHRAAGYGSVQ